eukprot:scaffold23376_cov20-Prasinocladus_malaysianus.AAC.1
MEKQMICCQAICLALQLSLKLRKPSSVVEPFVCRVPWAGSTPRSIRYMPGTLIEVFSAPRIIACTEAQNAAFLKLTKPR